MYKVSQHVTKEFLEREIAELSYNEDSFDNLHSKAEEFVKSKQWLECLEVLDKIAELYQPTSQLLVNKSICLFRLGYLREAIGCLEESLGLDLDNDHALTLLPKFRDRLKEM
jgi:tetratricopeptide (TPR) repeat protein